MEPKDSVYRQFENRCLIRLYGIFTHSGSGRVQKGAINYYFFLKNEETDLENWNAGIIHNQKYVGDTTYLNGRSWTPLTGSFHLKRLLAVVIDEHTAVFLYRCCNLKPSCGKC